MQFAKDVSDRVIFMDQGVIAEQGTRSRSLRIRSRRERNNSYLVILTARNSGLFYIVLACKPLHFTHGLQLSFQKKETVCFSSFSLIPVLYLKCFRMV